MILSCRDFSGLFSKADYLLSDCTYLLHHQDNHELDPCGETVSHSCSTTAYYLTVLVCTIFICRILYILKMLHCSEFGLPLSRAYRHFLIFQRYRNIEITYESLIIPVVGASKRFCPFFLQR